MRDVLLRRFSALAAVFSLYNPTDISKLDRLSALGRGLTVLARSHDTLAPLGSSQNAHKGRTLGDISGAGPAPSAHQ